MHNKNGAEIKHYNAVKWMNKLKPPLKYKIILHNDDYTLMKFIVTTRQPLFPMDYAPANQHVLIIHQQGQAIGGMSTAEITESKATFVNTYAKNKGMFCFVR